MKLEPLLDATEITGNTCLGVSKPTDGLPNTHGNCFDVKAGKAFKIVNFHYENLEYLLGHGLTWPVRIYVLEGWVAVIQDDRIPDNWYTQEHCVVCCPEHLLTFPQQSRLRREESRGQRRVFEGGSSNSPGLRPFLDEKGMLCNPKRIL